MGPAVASLRSDSEEEEAGYALAMPDYDVTGLWHGPREPSSFRIRTTDAADIGSTFIATVPDPDDKNKKLHVVWLVFEIEPPTKVWVVPWRGEKTCHLEVDLV